MHDSSLVLNLLVNTEIDKELSEIAEKHLKRIVINEASWADIDLHYLRYSVHKLLT